MSVASRFAGVPEDMDFEFKPNEKPGYKPTQQSQNRGAPLHPSASAVNSTVGVYTESDPSLSDVVTRIKGRLDNILNHSKK